MENFDAKKLLEMVEGFEQWFNEIEPRVQQLIKDMEDKVNQSKD